MNSNLDKSSNPLFSIVIPVYNVEDYLEECIESVLSQNFKDYEIILVNDGSTDNSGEICDKYSKIYSNISTIHKENGGLSDARNKGIDNSKGKFLLFIDSDDFICQNSLSNIYQTIQENNFDIDLIFLESKKYYTNNDIQDMNEGFDRRYIFKRDKQIVMNHLSTMNKFAGSAWAKVINRKLIIHNSLYFEKNLLSEDIEWMIRVLMCAVKFDYCEKDYYMYRQNREGSITSTNYPKRFKSLLYIIKKYSDLCIDSNISYKNEILSFISYEYTILLLLYSFLDKEEKQMYKSDIKKYKYLLDYKKCTKNKLIKLFYNVLGLNNTCKMLKIYIENRT